MRFIALLPPLLFAAVPAQANKVFVTNERGNSVTVLDSDSWEVLAEFDAKRNRLEVRRDKWGGGALEVTATDEAGNVRTGTSIP